MFYIYADGQMIYHLANPDLYLVKPTLDMELGKAGSLEFGILPDHAAYNKLAQMRTIVTVDYDRTEIFRGRVLSNKRNFDNSRTIYCEGDLAFLVDSVQKCEKYSGTTHALFRKIIAAHNARVEPYKQFTVGNITIENRPIELIGQSEENPNVGPIDYKQIAIDSIAGEWNNTYDFIETCLIDYCGGYLKTRRVGNTTYIDYVESYVDTCTQPISIGLNVLDLEEEITAEDLFTVLIPIGTDNITVASVNGGSDELVNTEAVAQYGRIIQTHVFNNVTEPSTLKENGLRYLNNNIAAQRTLTVKAIDLHMFNKDIMQIKLGSKVTISSTPHAINETLTCTEIEYDFEDPSQTSYTFGSQHQTLTQRYREDKRKDSDLYGNGGGGGKSSSGGGMMGWHIRDAAAAVSEEQEEQEEEKFKEFFNAYIATDPEHGDITLEAVYNRIENSINVLKSQCGIYIDADPEYSNINLQTVYNKVNQNESEINRTKTQIEQNATETGAQITLMTSAISKNTNDISSLDGSVASLTIAANAHGNSIISLNSDIIELNGRIDRLEADDVFANRVKTAIAGIDYLQAKSISASQVVATNVVTAPAMRIGELNVATEMHYHGFTELDNGKIQIGPAQGSPGSFNIADTQKYKDDVKAAKTEGAQSATLRSLGVDSVGSPYELNNHRYSDVVLKWIVQATKGDGTLYYTEETPITKAINVDAAYNAGVTAGVNQFELVRVYIRGDAETVYLDGGTASGHDLGGQYPNTLYVSDGSGGYRRLWTSLYYDGGSYSYNLRGSSRTRYKDGGAVTYYRKK
jgi:hypothetical protein